MGWGEKITVTIWDRVAAQPNLCHQTKNHMIASVKVRELLKSHGVCMPQSSTEWSGNVPLPEPIAKFYREVGPTNIHVKGLGNPTFIPSLSALWDHQAGYRWDEVTGERISGWHDDWIVIADEGADPYIYCRGEVLFAQHGLGNWNPIPLYPDLNAMMACIATLGTVMVNARESFVDDDCNIRPEFVKDATSRLTELLGSRINANTILKTAGWNE